MSETTRLVPRLIESDAMDGVVNLREEVRI